MLQPLEDMVKFFSEILDEAEIPYAIIGGVASAAFGRLRTTKDVDFVISLKKVDIKKLFNAIEDAGFPVPRRDFIEEKMKSNGVGKLTWTKRKYSVDFRMAQFNLDNEAIENSETLSIFGREISFAPPEDLIVYKLARFEENDRGDIIGILKVQGKSLDWGRINRLAKDFSVELDSDFVLENLDTVKSWIKRYDNDDE